MYIVLESILYDQSTAYMNKDKLNILYVQKVVLYSNLLYKMINYFLDI